MGRRLTLARGEKTQEAVARDLNISKSALSMYENGERIPRDELKILLSEYYKKDILYFFYQK